MSNANPDSAYRATITETSTEQKGKETWTITKSTWNNVNLTTTIVESNGRRQSLNIESDPVISKDAMVTQALLPTSLWKLNLQVVLTTVFQYLDAGEAGAVVWFVEAEGEYSPTHWHIAFEKYNDLVKLQLYKNSARRGDPYNYMTMSTDGFYESIGKFVDFAFGKLRESDEGRRPVIPNSKFKFYLEITRSVEQ